MRPGQVLCLIFCLCITFCFGGKIAAATEEQVLVDKAKATVEVFIPHTEAPQFGADLARARAIMIFPQIIKAGVVIGAEGGHGLLLARDPKTHAWSAPAFFTLGAGSIGFQIGAEATEVVFLIMNDKALNAVIDHQVKLGGDLSVAAGTIGKGREASTTTNLSSDIISYARAAGLFAGVSVEGAVVRTRESRNRAYYGRPLTAYQIVVRRQAEAPAAAPLQEALRRAER